ncbi:23S rRNA (pseudouridine(1915)-N(3))-methyltransferase RlmH, partial [Escherichia coli]|nr:23S rRNA (pseudouridine(1915)-N(3))-methyltransferase RlmH [Escherichia coli]
MKTTLLVVGRTVEQHYITAINDYIQRTKRSITFDMEVIPELKNTKSLSMEVQKEKEGELILKALQPGDVVVLLDEHGKEMRSLEFAEYMKRKMNTVNKRLVF